MAVFLRGSEDFGKEAGVIADIETDFFYESDAVINAMPLRAGTLTDETPVMGEIRRDGLGVQKLRAINFSPERAAISSTLKRFWRLA